MKYYNITVNGVAYSVSVEETAAGAAPVAAAPAAPVNPAPVAPAAPVASASTEDDDEFLKLLNDITKGN